MIDDAGGALVLTPRMRVALAGCGPFDLSFAIRRARDVGRGDASATDTPAAGPRAYPAPARRLEADGALLDRLGVEFALAAGVAPIARAGAVTVVASDGTRAARAALAGVEARLGPIAVAPSHADPVREAIMTARGGVLVREAERRTPAALSCRDWSRSRAGGAACLLFVLAASVIAFRPDLAIALVTLWVGLTLALVTGLRSLAALVELRHLRGKEQGWKSSRTGRVADADLPRVALLVPLFREREMAGRLARTLARLDYPRDRLDIALILEADDEVTSAALARDSLPPGMRVLRVPRGTLRTKPRALNYALDFVRGDIVGIYDAEDAPAPDQLRAVARGFAEAGPEVACLQGILDFYNARQTWLTRCFTIDYATWFRLVLPGLVRLGLPIPLGGTTVFFRRDVLEKIGRWDAHNVTEDADLGIRLARMGYRTRFIPSVTAEEATARVGPWIRQRSRWIKGYAVTWSVHMRRPVELWQALGPKGFLAFQIVFLGTLTQFLFAPFLWTFWMVPLGLPHPVPDLLGWDAFLTLAAVFLVSELLTLAIAAFSVAHPARRWLIWWVPLMHLYWPLAAVASWKGLGELLIRPFYWDKTAHGGSLDGAEPCGRSAH